MSRALSSRAWIIPGWIGILAVCLGLFASGAVHAKSARNIDARVDEAYADFRRSVKEADKYLKAAKGVLVIPEVKKAGLIVGGQWGEGALRIKRKTVAYYSMKAGSVGMQMGYQKANYLFIFLTEDALTRFRNSEGWDAGVDGGVTVIDQGFGGSLDTLGAETAVIAFIYGKQGLMGGMSIKGQKLSRIKPGK